MVERSNDVGMGSAMIVICMLFGGPTRYIHVRSKVVIFEDHPRIGPVLVGKGGDPLVNQPLDTSPFWPAYEAWAIGGKVTETVNDKTWCKYETHSMMVRRKNRQEPKA